MALMTHCLILIVIFGGIKEFEFILYCSASYTHNIILRQSLTQIKF